MKKVIFVTGCIASGKSNFMHFIQKKGFKTISADEIAHQLLAQNALKIAQILNYSHFIKDDFIDRKALGAFIFSDEKARKKLENFMHPLIYEEITKQISLCKSLLFIELPLFFENKNYQNLGKALLIYAPKKLCLDRLMKRNDLSEEEALLRLNAQMDIEEKRVLADFVIENTSSVDEFEKKCEQFLNNLRKNSF